jgi:HD-GYP domain-containing protein (c-di-GMP phosphodiesterase class II)
MPTRTAAPDRHDAIARSLLGWLATHDEATRWHCERVGSLSAAVGAELGLGPSRIATLRRAALLHDIGKLNVPERVLRKPGPLDERELEAMKRHSRGGHDLLVEAGLHAEAIYVLHHHERLDGSGYPDGLRGDEIPLESRVMLVADTFDAMISERPYRRAQPRPVALTELAAVAGRELDADCVVALLRALNDEIPVAGAPLVAAV